MKLLVIEDEPKIARALKAGFRQEHSTVEIYDTGTAGLAAAEADDYDVIVLDRMLPELNGIEVCQKLRQKKIMTPIIMLTAKSRTADKIDGLNAGADDYLAKPFSFDELLARVKALQRRPQVIIPSVLTCDDLSLDTQNYDVTRAGKSITLSSTEFALLEYLMRHPGQTLSKEVIIQRVWDYDADVLPNTVEAYIGYLRAKIDKPFKGSPLIHTVRGFGYKLGSKL